MTTDTSYDSMMDGNSQSIGKAHSLSTEELLKPRYKLTIRYPHYPFHGDVLFVDKDGELYHETEGYCQSIYKIMESNAKESKCFRLLEWWEERDKNDLPDFIRFYEPLPLKFSIWEVHQWRLGLKRPLVMTDCDTVWRELSTADLPATAQEYNNFINKNP